MKIERQKTKPTFDPIVITLETEEEANHLWHKLNLTENWGDYCKRRHIPDNLGGLNTRMWDALHRVFNPTSAC